jgi:hypothetical protein
MAPSDQKHAGSDSAQINWADPQLDGHEHAKKLQRKGQAWWWAYGFPTHLKGSTSRLFWTCKICNVLSDERKHYEITKGRNGPPRHLDSHQIDRSNSAAIWYSDTLEEKPGPQSLGIPGSPVTMDCP